jgi:hypothetical protein
MRNWWLRSCRRFVPASLRTRVFDAAADDFAVRRAVRLEARPGAIGRLTANALWGASVLLAAVQCWWLRRSSGSVPRGTGPGRDSWLARAARDIRLAGRRIRREPAFAGFAVATLAFGIGANIAVFSFVNAYLGRVPCGAPSPYPPYPLRARTS